MCKSSQISSNPTPISPPSPATITLLDPPQLSSAETIQGPCLTLKLIQADYGLFWFAKCLANLFFLHSQDYRCASIPFSLFDYSISTLPSSPGLSLSHSPPPSDPAHLSPLLSPPCNNRKDSSSPRRERMSAHVCFVLLAISNCCAHCSLRGCA